MDIKEDAYKFAVDAYSDKYRKAELDKPSVFHAIDVANKLENYGFDDNVIAAGYLHDIVEDTKYTKEDVLNLFGDDICSLVMGATEVDKKLSWEKRKLDSIVRMKNLDIRHKAVIVCDKISNTEDLILKFGKEGKEDFSSFNRGKNKKLWYWRNSYESLVFNQDANLPMFLKLRKNIDDISNMSDVLKNNVYHDMDIIDVRLNTSDIARELYYKKQENFKIKSLVRDHVSYVVNFGGNYFEGREDVISKLKDYLSFSGFNVLVLDNLSFFKNEFDGERDIIFIDNNDDARLSLYIDISFDLNSTSYLLLILSNIIDNMRCKLLDSSDKLYIKRRIR